MPFNSPRRARSDLPLMNDAQLTYGTNPQLPVSRSRRRSHLVRSLLCAESPPSTLPLVSRGAHPVSPCSRLATSRSPSASLSLRADRGHESAPKNLSFLHYDEASVQEEKLTDLVALQNATASARDHGCAVWTSVTADGTSEMRCFLEDQGVPLRVIDEAEMGVSRAKLEIFATAVTLVAHVPIIGAPQDGYRLSASQVAVVMLPKERTVITIKRGTESHAWQQHVVEVLRADVGQVRSRHIAHLICTMLDAMLETYFVALEYVGDVLDELEWHVLHDGDKEGHKLEDDACEDQPLRPRDILRLITRIKHELGLLRRQIWPLRECLTRLAVAPETLVDVDARLRVRESLDRTMQVLDVLECYRDVGHALLDLHLAAQNNRMQEVMQTLAVVTTIFVPLTFLAGIEGMNFSNQPELYGKWSYALFWLLVCFILGGQIVFFRKKGWI